ncbi:unnamed protein product [Clonostachys rosea f. rosea IK726]|uniref:Uncharacterized protein n=1 Tax=Clonostachys rosea f. rosea IK726 TaxID=1349383 RepID=A0ACA9TGR8_BIOOC|nr:unnamed protein product [Clonostachys rosea f. rosea IK726]
MALQPGDVVNFARVAWDIYYLGWTEDLRASRNYAEFGSDIRGLAHSLSILDQVINTANASLQNQGGHRALVRYDPVSLREIVGDYETTLRECRELLDDNRRYEGARNPLRNIEWNILVQPVADRLRQRILMHNSKIQLVLKPFEIDLLSRIRDDLHAIHRDITNQIFALRTQVHQLMGVLVPDLDTELSQRDTREVRLLQVPDQLAEQFRLITATESLDDGSEVSFGIQELSDAFILNYNRSTVSFRGGMLVTDRRPPVDHYINLLKCVWLFEKIEICSSSQAFSPESHWPGYINKLQEDLSQQCSRFDQQELVPPPIPPQLPRAMLSIWPPKPVANLLDIITPDEMMERMLKLPLQGTQSARRQVILNRRMGSNGKRFRAEVSGEQETNGERARQEKETIDFEISNTLINPLYAMLRNNILVPELLLKTDERIAKLSFNRMKDVLQFQRAVTGFKVWDHWTQNNVMVSFVIAGTRQSIVERACLQLWVPEALDTSLITASDTHSDPGPSRSPTAMSSPSGAIPIPSSSPRTSRMFGSAPLSSSPDAMSSIYSPNPANSQSSASRHGSVMSSPWGFTSSPPDPLDRSPGRTRTQDRQNTTSTHNSHPTTYNSHPTSPFRNSLPSHFGMQHVRPPTDRSASISSAVSLATTSNGSSSSEHTTTIATGPWSTGTLHQCPPKPMLVLFTHNESTRKKAIVTINVDSETLINPERCNCRQAGTDGFSCPIAAVERRSALSLEAYRYEAAAPQQGMGTSSGDTDADWNLARLAVNNPASRKSSNAWHNMKRLSIMFPSPGERARFGGTPNACHCSIRTEAELQSCLRLGHKGYLGEVKEYHRVKMNEYEQSRWEGKQDVVMGLMY